MSLKAKVEAIIYAAEEPVTLNELAALLKDTVLAELRTEEEARLALNEIISDGHPVSQAEDQQEFHSEEGAEIAEDASLSAEEVSVAPFAVREAAAKIQPEQPEAVPTKDEEGQAEEKEQLRAVKARLSAIIDELIADYATGDRGMEIRQIAGGYRMTTKPEHHDVVVSFAKSLKPPVRLSLQALETLSVIAYKQPVTVPEISEIRGVDCAGVIATLLDRKLITTAGRKQVIGRPILYKTTKEFLLRFGLNDISELPSMEEFEKLGEPGAPSAPAVGAVGWEPGVRSAPAVGAMRWEPQAELFSPPSADAPPATASSREVEPVAEAMPDPNHHPVGNESALSQGGSCAAKAQQEESRERP